MGSILNRFSNTAKNSTDQDLLFFVCKYLVWPLLQIARTAVQFYRVNHGNGILLKFIYSEKATKFCEISTLLLSYVMPVKSKVKISQNFVAFSEYMNFNCEARGLVWSMG